MTVFIGEGELIVGNVTSKIRGGEILPEINAQWMLDELDDFATREWDRFEPLTDDEKTTIREFLSWWKGESLYDMWRARIPEDKLRFLTNGLQGGTVMAHNSHYLTHNACDYEMVLTKGLDAIKQEVDEELAKLDVGDLREYQTVPVPQGIEHRPRGRFRLRQEVRGTGRGLGGERKRSAQKSGAGAG